MTGAGKQYESIEVKQDNPEFQTLYKEKKETKNNNFMSQSVSYEQMQLLQLEKQQNELQLKLMRMMAERAADETMSDLAFEEPK